MFYIKTHTFVSKANLHVLRQNQKFCKENVITRAKISRFITFKI